MSLPEEANKIVLLRPPYRTGTYDPELQECLGIEMLAAVLRRADYQVKLIDALLQNLNVDGVVRAAAEFQPDVVGFSLMSSGSLESTAAIAAGLQASLSTGVLMIAGGQQLTTHPQSLSACQPVRLALQAEGEESLPELIRRRQKGEPPDDLPGLVRLTTDRQLIINEPNHPLAPLDSLPFAARDFAGVLRRLCLPANIQGSRGCNGRCSFCATPGEYRTVIPRWRGRSLQNLVDEMAQLQREFGFSTFNFVDDNFLGPMPFGWQRAEAFADELLRRNLKVAYGFQCRVMLARPALLAKLYRSGLRYIFLGVESANPVILRRFRKPTPLARVLQTIAAWRSLGIVVEIGMIPFHPWTTFATLEADYEFLQQAGCLNLRTATNRLLALPGTPIADELLDSDVTVVEPDGSLNWQFNSTPVAEFYHRLLWLLQPIQPVWTLAATAVPSLLLAAAIAEEPAAQPALRQVQMVCDVLNKWVAKTAFVCLDACQKRLPGNDFISLRTEAKKLARLQVQELSHVSFGRLSPAIVAEVAEIVGKM